MKPKAKVPKDRIRPIVGELSGKKRLERQELLRWRRGKVIPFDACTSQRRQRNLPHARFDLIVITCRKRGHRILPGHHWCSFGWYARQAQSTVPIRQ